MPKHVRNAPLWAIGRPGTKPAANSRTFVRTELGTALVKREEQCSEKGAPLMSM